MGELPVGYAAIGQPGEQTWSYFRFRLTPALATPAELEDMTELEDIESQRSRMGKTV